MIIAAILLSMTLSAQADQMITLYPGQCVGVNGNQFCWHYRPSVWDHPDQPARPCDFNRSCPITYLLSDGYPSLPSQKNAQDPNLFRYCKKTGQGEGERFSLVQTRVKESGEKVETVLADYAEDKAKCEREEQAFRYPASYRGYPAPIVDTYVTPPICPGTYHERKSLKDIGKDFKKVLGL